MVSFPAFPDKMLHCLHLSRWEIGMLVPRRYRRSPEARIFLFTGATSLSVFILTHLAALKREKEVAALARFDSAQALCDGAKCLLCGLEVDEQILFGQRQILREDGIEDGQMLLQPE